MPWISNPWLRYQCYPAINGGPFQCHKKRISGIDLPCIDPSYVLILICEAEWPPSRGNWNGTSSHFHYVWCFIHRIIIHVYIYIHIYIYIHMHIYIHTYTYIHIYIHTYLFIVLFDVSRCIWGLPSCEPRRPESLCIRSAWGVAFLESSGLEELNEQNTI